METKKPKQKNKPGPVSTLTKNLSLQIRKLHLQGFKIDEIREKLNIKESTWESWYYRDTQNFRSNFTLWRREKMLNQAEINLEDFSIMPTEIQTIEDSDDEMGERAVVVTDPRLVKIKLDATTYITDTIGKDIYSKRIIQEDPEAAKKEEVDALRQTIKKIMIHQRSRYVPLHRDKMAKALK